MEGAINGALPFPLHHLTPLSATAPEHNVGFANATAHPVDNVAALSTLGRDREVKRNSGSGQVSTEMLRIQ